MRVRVFTFAISVMLPVSKPAVVRDVNSVVSRYKHLSWKPTFDEVFTFNELLKMEASKLVKGSEFHVLLSGLKLSDKLENHIASEIQRVVAAALTDYPNPDDPDGNDGVVGGRHPHGTGRFGPYVVIPSKEWMGRWLQFVGKDFKVNLEQVNQIEKNLQKGIQRIG